MANPTTNYSFILPTPTDLVTDLPADFEVALQGVDTQLKALQPGTTVGDLAYSSATANTNVRLGIGTAGQVLAVVSGVPAWATTADQTPLTTKGDIFTFSTVDARLPVGTNGQVLTADSTQSTGLSYTTISSGGMTLISTTSLTGASVTLSSIPGTHKDLRVVIRNFQPATDDENIQMRYNGDSTANRYSTATIGTGSVSTFSDDKFSLGAPTDSTATKNFQIINIFDYTNTTTFKLATDFNILADFTTPTSISYNNKILGYNQTPAITSLTFFPGGGNFTAGTVLLFGVS